MFGMCCVFWCCLLVVWCVVLMRFDRCLWVCWVVCLDVWLCDWGWVFMWWVGFWVVWSGWVVWFRLLLLYCWCWFWCMSCIGCFLCSSDWNCCLDVGVVVVMWFMWVWFDVCWVWYFWCWVVFLLWNKDWCWCCLGVWWLFCWGVDRVCWVEVLWCLFVVWCCMWWYSRWCVIGGIVGWWLLCVCVWLGKCGLVYGWGFLCDGFV